MQKTCIVIPCFNEANRLPVAEFIAFYTTRPIHFCFVNDGSSDETASVLEQLRNGREDRISVVNLTQNQGKAEAVRVGILESIKLARFDIIGYFDADLSTPLVEIERLSTYFGENILVVFGSRVKRLGVTIDRNPMRHYMGRIFSTFSSLILTIPIYDSQCGAKLFRTEIAAVLFADRFITKWLFDIEIFGRLVLKIGRQNIDSHVIEVPLNRWVEVGKSKLKLTYLLKVPFELLRIYVHLKRETQLKTKA